MEGCFLRLHVVVMSFYSEAFELGGVFVLTPLLEPQNVKVLHTNNLVL